MPHALDMPPLKTGYVESPSPFTPLGAKGMGEGGGAGIHAVCAALQDALKSQGGPIVWRSCNPYYRVWRYLQDPDESRNLVEMLGPWVGNVGRVQGFQRSLLPGAPAPVIDQFVAGHPDEPGDLESVHAAGGQGPGGSEEHL